ncbi:MAG TPA: efflux RND transporter periplasmic adaptor subunit [Caulobacteraceae bacterium]|nr:efflux RND transporter periplasmic adaptor subunit [Caulobacteraceae bacterium]
MDDAAPLGRGSAQARKLTPRRISGRAPGYLGLAALLAALASGCGGQGQGRQPPPPTVGVVTIEPQPVTLTTELPGRTSPYEVADVRPQVGGIIQAKLFSEGSIVHAGQVLYQIEPAPFLAAYDQAKAQLANAAANLVTTRAKAERFATLMKQDSVAAQDYDDAEAAFKQAQATVQQDRAAAEAARINLAFTRVTAPITGRIGISTVTRGALVSADQPTALDTIQRLDPIYVDVTQSVAQVVALRRQIAQGQVNAGAAGSAETHLTLDDGTTYGLAGRLQVTDVTVDQTTDAVTLRALFPNPAGLLLPGMFVRATIVEGVDPAGLLVPQQGIGHDQKGQPTALVVNNKGVVELRQLQVSQTVANEWLVTSGLSPGDRVIVEGTQSAEPGAQVRAVPADNVR